MTEYVVIHISQPQFASIESLCKIKFGLYYANPLYFAHHLYINGAEVKDLVIPESVTEIGATAFINCSSITSVNIPNSVTSIGGEAFSGCSGLTSVDIPNSVTSIGRYAFFRCSGLTSVDNPNSLTSIGFSVFTRCSGLTSVSIPSSVKTIDDYAFSSCTKIQEIYSANPVPPSCKSNTFFDVPTDATVYVPFGSIPDYSASVGWNHFFNFVETDNFPNAVEGIFEDAESASKNVYNMQGVCVKRNATQSDIDALPSGLYIIGGKKIVK